MDISVIMPVFNTGLYLAQAIDSVLNQKDIDGSNVPSYELVIVDDHSSDHETLSILENVSGDSRIRILKNERQKGAAGARNTGILHAHGKWIGFLDSDDLWFPSALAVRWRFIQNTPSAKWVASHYLLELPGRCVERSPLSKRSPMLYESIKGDYDAGQPTCLARPVETFLQPNTCILQTGTVLINRELLLSKGMFEESLRRAEDFHLWLKCANDNDLWILPFDSTIYRLRPGSLTRVKEPRFFCEDQMIDLLLREPTFTKYRDLLRQRMDFVLSDYCYFYRKNKMRLLALQWAFGWVRKRPIKFGAWKQLAAAMLWR